MKSCPLAVVGPRSMPKKVRLNVPAFGARRFAAGPPWRRGARSPSQAAPTADPLTGGFEGAKGAGTPGYGWLARRPCDRLQRVNGQIARIRPAKMTRSPVSADGHRAAEVGDLRHGYSWAWQRNG